MAEIRKKWSTSVTCRLLVVLLLGANLQSNAAVTKRRSTPTTAHKSVANDAEAKARDILTALSDHEPAQIHGPRDRAAFEETMRRAQIRREKMTAGEAQLELLGPSIISLLAKNLNNADTDINNACCEVLKFFGPSAIPEILSNYTQSSKSQYFAMILNTMPAEALPAVLPMLKNESEAKRMLGIALLNRLLAQSNSSFFPIRRIGATGLPRTIILRSTENRSPLPEAFQKSLCQIAQAEKVATLRASLCDLLGLLGTGVPAVSQTLIALASTDSEPTVRLEAIIALGNIRVVSNDDAIDGALRKFSADDTAEQCRAAAIEALMRTDNSSPKNLAILRTALSDRSKLVASASMDVINRLGLKARPLAPDLIKIINDNQDSSTVCEAIVALSMLQSPSANELDMLAKLLDSPDYKIRNSVLLGLGKMHEIANPVVPKITELLSKSDSSSTREAISALGEIGPGAASAEDALKALLPSRGINSMYAQQALKKIDPSFDPPPRESRRAVRPPAHTEGPPSIVPVPSTSPSSSI